MRPIPEILLVTTYAGAPGVHLMGYNGGPLLHLCRAARDQHREIRHYWIVYELHAPDAPTVDCQHCAELLQVAVRQ